MFLIGMTIILCLMVMTVIDGSCYDDGGGGGDCDDDDLVDDESLWSLF